MERKLCALSHGTQRGNNEDKKKMVPSILTLLATAVAVLLAVAIVGAENFITCPPDGVLSIQGQSLGQSVFTGNLHGCNVIISTCSAESLTFAAISNVKINIVNLTCLSASSTYPPNCILFNGALTGGETQIQIDGVTRTVGTGDGAVGSGSYNAIYFNQEVTARSISIKNVHVHCNVKNIADGSELRIGVVNFVKSVAGSGGPDSFLNVSENKVSGSVVSSSSSSNSVKGVYVGVVRFDNQPSAGSCELNSFETFYAGGNSMDGIVVSLSSPASSSSSSAGGVGTMSSVVIAHFGADWTVKLLGTENSAMLFRGNTMSGATVECLGGNPQKNRLRLHMVQFVDVTISGVASFIIDQTTILGATVSADSFDAQVAAVLLDATLRNIRQVVLSNTLFSAGMLTVQNQRGPAILCGAPRFLSVHSVLVSDSVLACSIFRDMTVTGASATIWAVNFGAGLNALQSVAVVNVKLVGTFTTNGDSATSVDLRLVRFGPVSNVTQLSVTQSSISASVISQKGISAALGFFESYLTFPNDNSSSSSSSQYAIDFSANNITVFNALVSNATFVCAGIIVFDPIDGSEEPAYPAANTTGSQVSVLGKPALLSSSSSSDSSIPRTSRFGNQSLVTAGGCLASDSNNNNSGNGKNGVLIGVAMTVLVVALVAGVLGVVWLLRSGGLKRRAMDVGAAEDSGGIVADEGYHQHDPAVTTASTTESSAVAPTAGALGYGTLN